MPGAPGGADNAPRAAPMMTPQVPAGEMEEAKSQVSMALKILTKALAVFGVHGEKGKALMHAIKSLAKSFGQDEESTDELQPAAIKQMLAGLGGPGAPPPGGPPGAPPGAPPPGGPPGMAPPMGA
jgi:hypothetical protein